MKATGRVRRDTDPRSPCQERSGGGELCYQHVESGRCNLFCPLVSTGFFFGIDAMRVHLDSDAVAISTRTKTRLSSMFVCA